MIQLIAALFLLASSHSDVHCAEDFSYCYTVDAPANGLILDNAWLDSSPNWNNCGLDYPGEHPFTCVFRTAQGAGYFDNPEFHSAVSQSMIDLGRSQCDGRFDMVLDRFCTTISTVYGYTHSPGPVVWLNSSTQ